MNVQCCQCGRYRVNGAWAPGNPAPSDPASHTYCPRCLVEFLRNERPKRRATSPAGGGLTCSGR
jgi:hypothetical protein